VPSDVVVVLKSEQHKGGPSEVADWSNFNSQVQQSEPRVYGKYIVLSLLFHLFAQYFINWIGSDDCLRTWRLYLLPTRIYGVPQVPFLRDLRYWQ
jgi:hypothetical protein